jgi:hypothetical protein
MVHVVENLPSKCKVLSSNSTTTKKKKRKEGKEKRKERKASNWVSLETMQGGG